MPDTQNSANEHWEAKNYIEHRLNEQQNYHSGKSSDAQTQYKRLGWLQIVLAASIPVVSVIAVVLGPNYQSYFQILIAILGAVISVCVGLQSFGQFQQSWLHHRAISEALKTEKVKYVTASGEYTVEGVTEQQRLSRLVANVEQLLGSEHQKWQHLKEQGTGKGQDDA